MEKAIVQPSHHQETPPKDTDEQGEQNPFHKFGKIGCLVCVWILMVMFLTSTEEKVLERRQLAIPIAGPRIYNFPKLPTGTRINATLSGAFLAPETAQDQLQQKRLDYISRKSSKLIDKEKENYISVYLQSNTSRNLTQPKLFAVTKPELFDTSNISKILIMFDIGEDNLELLQENNESLQLVIQSNFTKTPEPNKQEMPLMFIYDISPINRQVTSSYFSIRC